MVLAQPLGQAAHLPLVGHCGAAHAQAGSPQVPHWEVEVTMLRGDLAEAHRVNNEQNDWLHKIDVHMAHIVDNYLNINL